MSHLANVKKYILPADLLLRMLSVYRYLGKNEHYATLVKNNLDIIRSKTLETDTYFLSLLIGLNISDNRMRLIITKDSEPRTKEERSLAMIKTVIKYISSEAIKFSFNASDLITMVNKIMGRAYTTYDASNLTHQAQNKLYQLKSRRLLFNNVLDEYTLMFNKHEFEPLFLSSIVIVEMFNIVPFTKGNDLAQYLALYYMMVRSDVESLIYNSFFERLYRYKDEFRKELNLASLNYFEGFMQVFDLNRLLFKMIEESYQDLETYLRNEQFEENMFKSDHIEQTIESLAQTFSKSDIIILHPNISVSTVERVLKKLRKENRIRPLGTGRGAKWIKIEEEEHDIARLLR